MGKNKKLGERSLLEGIEGYDITTLKKRRDGAKSGKKEDHWETRENIEKLVHTSADPGSGKIPEESEDAFEEAPRGRDGVLDAVSPAGSHKPVNEYVLFDDGNMLENDIIRDLSGHDKGLIDKVDDHVGGIISGEADIKTTGRTPVRKTSNKRRDSEEENLRENEERLERISALLDEEKSSRESVEEEFAEYRKSLGRLVEERNAKIAELEEQFDIANAGRARAEEKLKDYREKIETLVKEKIERLEQANKDVQKKLADQKVECRGLIDKKNDMEKLLHEARLEIEELTEKLDQETGERKKAAEELIDKVKDLKISEKIRIENEARMDTLKKKLRKILED